MTTHRHVRGAALALTIAATAALAVAPGPASAQTARQQQRQDAQLTFVKTRAHAEVERREAELTRLQTQVNASTRVTASHRSTLLGQISSAADGLRGVDAKVQADTDVNTARADAQVIVTGYRVFVLVAPRTHIVIAADIDSAGAARLSAVADKLDAAIAQAQAKGKDVSGAKASLADMRAKVADAKAKAGAVPDSVLPLTPAGYPGNKPTLVAARDSVQTARGDLRTAIADARAVVAALK